MMEQDDNPITPAEHTSLNQLLERRPRVAVPEGFAARVASSLPPQRLRRVRVPVGRAIAAAAALLLTVAMFALAPASHPSLNSFAFDIEMLLLVQLCGIGWYLSLRRE
jgi:hypothetical protein